MQMCNGITLITLHVINNFFIEFCLGYHTFKNTIPYQTNDICHWKHFLFTCNHSSTHCTFCFSSNMNNIWNTVIGQWCTEWLRNECSSTRRNTTIPSIRAIQVSVSRTINEDLFLVHYMGYCLNHCANE